MIAQQHLLQMLGDGEVHSGSELAAILGVSRAAVWKQLSQLRALGLEVNGEAGQGYRLGQPYEALDRATIQSALSASACGVLHSLNTLWECDSTNNVLLDGLNSEPLPAGIASVCLAELQTGGRGRRGRRWVSPPGGGVWCSVSWTWDAPPADLSALSLAAGAHVLRALQKLGCEGLQVKWPNDLLADGRKIGGILIDVQGDLAGPITVVVGLGLNLIVSDATRDQVNADGGQPPIGLYELGVTRSRNLVAADVVSALVDMLQNYAGAGFSRDKDFWCANDFLRNKPVMVSGSSALSGVAMGVNEQGYLRVVTEHGEQLVGAGDVSLRLNPQESVR